MFCFTRNLRIGLVLGLLVGSSGAPAEPRLFSFHATYAQNYPQARVRMQGSFLAALA